MGGLSGLFLLAQAWLAWRKSEDMRQEKERSAKLSEQVVKMGRMVGKLRRALVRERERNKAEMLKQEANWKWDRKQKHYWNNVAVILTAKLHGLGANVDDLPEPPKREDNGQRD